MPEHNVPANLLLKVDDIYKRLKASAINIKNNLAAQCAFINPKKTNYYSGDLEIAMNVASQLEGSRTVAHGRAPSLWKQYPYHHLNLYLLQWLHCGVHRLYK